MIAGSSASLIRCHGAASEGAPIAPGGTAGPRRWAKRPRTWDLVAGAAPPLAGTQAQGLEGVRALSAGSPASHFGQHLPSQQLDASEDVGLGHSGPAHAHAEVGDPGPMLGKQHVADLRRRAHGEAVGGEAAELLLRGRLGIERQALEAPGEIGLVLLDEMWRGAPEGRLLV